MYIKECRSCKNRDLQPILDLGAQPPSNSFIKADDLKLKNERKYPLSIVLCAQCSLVQLDYTVDPGIIFGDYVYVTSNTKPLVKHLNDMAKSLFNFACLRETDLVIDIGCNDGSLLKGYPGDKVRLLGVEPSSVYKIASDRGLRIVNEFFNLKTAENIVTNNGRATLITATNVFAHVPDQGDFLNGINKLLNDDGMFVIEVPHILEMIKQNLFDTIYHEHVFYYSLMSINKLLIPHGLRIFSYRAI